MKKEDMSDIDKLIIKPIKKGVARAMDKNEGAMVIPETLYIPHSENNDFLTNFKVIKEEQEAPTKSKEKSILYSYFSEFFRFSLTAGAIFAILFVGMNSSSFLQIMDKKINPGKFVDTQIALENVIQNEKLSHAKRLPTAGIKRDGKKTFPTLALSIPPLENRIIIPSIGKNIPIVSVGNETLLTEDWHGLEEDIQDGLRDGVVHYPGTAVPGQNGNVFITGHSSYYPWDDGKFKDVFALLHDVSVGDTFTVYWNQRQFNYRIREIKVVPPKDTSVLDQPSNEHVATLMTCTPVGTANNRLIVVADEI